MDLSHIVAVHLILAKAKDALSYKQTKAAIAEASRRYEEELGVKIKVKKVTILGRDPTRRWSDGVEYPRLVGRFLKGKHYLERMDFTDSKMVRLLVVPPQKIVVTKFVFGIASPCSYRSEKFTPLALIAATPTNWEGETRLPHAVVTIEHEIGHTLCAKHTEIMPASVMHPYGLNFVTALLPNWLRFDGKSVSESLNFLSNLK